MKIFIDESHFNRAIKDGKFQLADWLISQNCPISSSVYFQNLEIDSLNWLYSRSIKLEQSVMKNVIESTNREDVIDWFITRGLEVDWECINSCIRTGDASYTKKFLFKFREKLKSENYQIALLAENVEILDILKELDCPFEIYLIEKVLKYRKRVSIKWLVNNGLFLEL